MSRLLKIEVKNNYGVVEVAKTKEEIEKGLMWRKSLPPNTGMIFLFKDKAKHVFWMKNTYIPLSLCFVDDDMVIFQAERMEPLSEKLVKATKPCQIVVEMPQGWFDNMVGEKLKIK